MRRLSLRFQRLGRERRAQRGATAVEFAIVVTLLLTLILGIMDYGFYFYVQHVITGAAREGARAASTWDTLANATTDASNTVTDVMRRGALLSASGSVACSSSPCTTGTCCQIESEAGPPIGYRVLVRFPVGSVTGFLPASMIPAAARSKAIMRRE